MEKTQAETLAHELHPAFAGYIHDGVITHKDVLGCIFHLENLGYINFIWESDDPLKKIVQIMKLEKIPTNKMDQTILLLLFSNDKKIISAKIPFELMETLRHAIQENIKLLGEIDISNVRLSFENLTITVNGNEVDTPQKLKNFYKIMELYFIPVFMVAGLFILSPYILRIPFAPIQGILNRIGLVSPMPSNANEHAINLVMGSIFFFFPLLTYIAAKRSKKNITSDYKGDKRIKIAYDELYDFLKSHPLNERKMDNEFLAYSIAYGINTSWNKEFGLYDYELDKIQSTREQPHISTRISFVPR